MEAKDPPFDFKDLFDSTAQLIHYENFDGSVRIVNPAWLKVLQYSAEEVEGQPICNFILPECVHEYRTKARAARDTQTAQDIRTVLVSKSGEPLALEGQLVCISDGGKPAYVRGVFIENLNGRPSSGSLRKGEGHRDDFFKAVPDGVVIIDQDDIILDWNSKAEQIFGFTAEEAIRCTLAETVVPRRYREVHLRAVERFITEHRNPVFHQFMQLSALRKDGSEICVNANVSSVRPDGKWLFIGFVTNSSNNKNLEERLIRKEAELLQSRRLDEKKDEFLSLASHELKTPLTTVKAYTQIGLSVAEKNNMTLLAEYLRKANRHIDKLTYLINELLDISKIQAGKLELTCTRVLFTSFAEDVISSLQHITPQRLRLVSCAPVYVDIDTTRVEQVITNMISNASKFGPGAGQIDITCDIQEDQLVFSVQDYGIGIPDEKVDKIFDRFYRVEEITPGFSGLGIGLYIAAEIIRRHRGHIWVESVPGSGSRFSFSLPIAE